MVESTMITIAILGAGIVSTFAVLKNKVSDSIERDNTQDKRLEEYQKTIDNKIYTLEAFMNEKAPLLEHLSKVENAFGKKLDEYGNLIVQLREKTTQAPTMKEVRDEFVSKEMFKQMEKHIDEKFDRVEMGLTKILEKLEKA